MFFFQAEDGIRDLVRSRGLGDVYKRQVPVGWSDHTSGHITAIAARALGAAMFEKHVTLDRTTVSYTHLTLPTSDLV